jgi:hypothetical protein
MSNGLFIRSYPAPGAKVEPATYGPGKFGYFMIVSVPVLIVWVAGPAKVIGSMWLPWGVGVYALVVISATALIRSLKLEVRTDGISYSSLFRGGNFLAFSEISTAVLNTNPHTRAIKIWSNAWDANTLVITPDPETGKPILKIPLDYFPTEARDQLVYLLRPEEWDVQA